MKNSITVPRQSFQESKSWAKAAGNKDYLLQHEQRHFDLTAVYAQLTVNELGLFPNPCQHPDSVKAIITRLREAHDQEQSLYDLESRHGDDPVGQQRWEDGIQRRMIALKMLSKD